MKKVFLILITIFSLTFSWAQSEITVKELQEWIYYLASDDKKGRLPCSPQTKAIAQRLRDEYKRHGLELLFDNGFQYFEITGGIKFSEDNYLKIGRQTFVLDKDYKVYPFSDTGQFFTKELVFVGYGLDIRHGDTILWNDYKDVDVKGKWVIIFRGVPQKTKLKKDLQKKYASERKKVSIAKDYGARGVIFVNPFSQTDKLIHYAIPRVLAKESLPVIHVKRNVINKLIPKNKKSVFTSASSSFVIKQKVSLSIHYDIVKCKTQNVVALLRGSDPRLSGRYIVIGAHYDHLGMGGFASGSRMPDTMAIHNGADDNASGTAGVIELMEYFVSVKDSLGRSIIFVNFSAEEQGLLGSKYFVNHLPVPKDSIDLMINFDMIGKAKNGASFLGLGSAKQLKAIFNQVSYDSTILKVKPYDKVFGGSDHAPFIDVGIPAIFVYASSGEGYHTPFDDADKINYYEQVNILNFVASFVIKVSNFEQHLEFVKQKEQKKDGYKNSMKVQLGIRPAFDYDGKGLKVDAVIDGGIADKTGIETGDIIIQIGKKKVDNIYDYMNALSKIKPGDKVKITVLRNKQKLDLLAQF